MRSVRCAEAENRIKEAQVGLFATRTSCQHFQSNQLRMLLAALGFVLIERLRALALQGTALASAQVYTLRIKLLHKLVPSSRATPGAFACIWPQIGPVPLRCRRSWGPGAARQSGQPTVHVRAVLESIDLQIQNTVGAVGAPPHLPVAPRTTASSRVMSRPRL